MLGVTPPPGYMSAVFSYTKARTQAFTPRQVARLLRSLSQLRVVMPPPLTTKLLDVLADAVAPSSQLQRPAASRNAARLDGGSGSVPSSVAAPTLADGGDSGGQGLGGGLQPKDILQVR